MKISRRSSTALLLVAAASAAGVSAPATAAPTVSSRIAGYTAGPATVTEGQNITIKGQAQLAKGTVWVAAPGTAAVVYFDPDGARPNAAVKTVKADAAGNFTVSFKASASGKWMVTIPQTATLKPFSTSQKYIRVTPAPKPTSTLPTGTTCPSWAPIKGNASSHIYHVPGGRYYAVTRPEICFTTETAAVKAGYRRSKA